MLIQNRSGQAREKAVVTGVLKAPSFLISNMGNTYREVQQRSGESTTGQF